MADKTNKISIYLLKEGFSETDVLKEEYDSIALDSGNIYHERSGAYTPSWVPNFFGRLLGGVNLTNQSSKAVFFKKLSVGGKEYICAIPFGYGHSMFDKSKCVDNFGLKLVLNIVSRDSIRKIGKRTLSSDPKNTLEQLSKIGAISDFGIDIEQDLVEHITGQPKPTLKTKFGKNLVTGKTQFTASMKVDVTDVDDFISDCIEYYGKDDYKQDFEFIDQVIEIKDSDELNDKLVSKLKGEEVEGVQAWLAVPEIIEWEDVEGFSFKSSKKNLFPDISLTSFLESLNDNQLKNLDLEALKRRRATAYRVTSDDQYDSWSVYQCLYCEITEATRTVILTNGKWYEIDKDFVESIEESYARIVASSTDIDLIAAHLDEHEDAYNARLALSIENSVLMDRKNIRYGGGASSIEFCDVYDAESKTFIHIKNYYGSSALSHLFAQGRVSGQLFLNDRPFREKVKEKERVLPIEASEIPDPTEYKVVFGIISASEKPLNLPFFSKVNLKNEMKMLEAFGFKDIYLTKVQRA